MGELSIRELNNNISKVLSRVEAGETIDITRNGKAIAEIRPKPPVRDAAWWKAYRETKELLAQGLPLNFGKVTDEDKYGDAAL